ncbi:MAG: hypothetical protein JJ908_12765 [Rhizobiales bacterium]|nr:hypothetical protein [Hyphomicrobiales bacterium]MBO6699696.1 hypothetical protein [Hyphomicrobiales bacterium]MBO6737234.1 hypothetical protein [Hyphomicrobiales bacterium]MBO6911692.1 hypothetical protein [Hyphomicrobiales bacterium]MBO6954886.1 hypothetical protein [Hyphomicrobiales bacterium]
MREVHARSTTLEAEPDPRIAALERRVERERAARKAAEAVIEEKSRELFDLAKELELQLSGSVKVLADVLAMARPELFQQAGKVQRWARRIAPHLEIKRVWELDLAAMLYPLGMLSLPDNLTSKKVLGEPLTQDEHDMIAESVQVAHGLINTIPKMQAVAETVLYCNRGFDGSGYPPDGPKGKDIPKSARILKVLIDLADVATGTDKKRDFQPLLDKRYLYDVDILKVAYKSLNISPQQQAFEGQYMSVQPGQLIPGDIIRADIVDANNQLLLAAGSVLSDITIRRLFALYASRRIDGAVNIARVTSDK